MNTVCIFIIFDYALTLLHFDKDQIIWITGLMHHIPVLYCSYNVLMDNNFWIDKENYSTTLSMFMISHSTSYFVYDVLLQFVKECIYKKPDIFLHAVSCCSVFAYIYMEGKYHFYGAAFLTFEISSPFLYAAFFLNRQKKIDTLLFQINSAMLVFTFFASRICFGNYIIMYELWPHIGIFFRMVALILTALNHIWFGKLLLKCRQLLLS